MLSTKKPLYHASGCSYAFCCANAAGASGRNRTRNPRFTKPLRYRCATLAKPRPAVYHTWKQRNGSNISMMRQRERGKRTGHAPRSPRTMASSFARVSVSSLSAMVRFSLAARRASPRRSSSTSALSAVNASDERDATPPPKTVA